MTLKMEKIRNMIDHDDRAKSTQKKNISLMLSRFQIVLNLKYVIFKLVWLPDRSHNKQTCLVWNNFLFPVSYLIYFIVYKA